MRKYKFKDFVNELGELINSKSLYFKIYQPENSHLKEIFKKAFENKLNEKEFDCNEIKLKKILNALKNIEKLNVAFIKELCKYLDLSNLDDVEEIEILTKEEVSDKETLKKLRTLVNSHTMGLKRSNKPYLSAYLLRGLLKLLVSLHNVNKNKINEVFKDNTLSLEKLEIFNDSLKWLINKPEILTIIILIPLDALQKLKNNLN